MSSSSSSSASSSRSPSPTPRSPSPEPDEFVPASPEVVAAYDSLMASLMPDITIPAPAPVAVAPAEEDAAGANADAAAEAALGRPLTKAEKQNAKKKRRKERERQLRAEADAVRAADEPVVVDTEQPVDFPLFSAVRPVSLSTVEHYPVTSNPRAVPLPAEQRARIARLAAEAAVSVDDIAVAFPSSLPEQDVDCYTLLPGQDMRAKHEKGKKGRSGIPRVFVLGAEAKCVAVPLLRPEEPTPGPRKRRRVRAREFPPAQFWEPERGAEGRSAGYFYGWSV